MRKKDSSIKIERGIEQPPRRTYPFADMEKGDSFFVADKSDRGRMIRSTASQAGRRLEAKFSVRKVEGGYRVFRL